MCSALLLAVHLATGTHLIAPGTLLIMATAMRPPQGIAIPCHVPNRVLTMTSYPGCTDFFVDVPVEYEYYKPTFPVFTSQSEATQRSLDMTERTPSPPNASYTGPYQSSSTFNISARYCPAKGKKEDQSETLLLLTHGIGFDKRFVSLANKKSVQECSNITVTGRSTILREIPLITASHTTRTLQASQHSRTIVSAPVFHPSLIPT